MCCSDVLLSCFGLLVGLWLRVKGGLMTEIRWFVLVFLTQSGPLVCLALLPKLIVVLLYYHPGGFGCVQEEVVWARLLFH